MKNDDRNITKYAKFDDSSGQVFPKFLMVFAGIFVVLILIGAVFYFGFFKGDAVNLNGSNDEINDNHTLPLEKKASFQILSNMVDFYSSTSLSGLFKAFVADGLVYVVSGNDHEVQVLDVSDPSDIRLIGSIIDNGSLTLSAPIDIFVEDGLAYVISGGERGIQVLDVSDPSDIRPWEA